MIRVVELLTEYNRRIWSGIQVKKAHVAIAAKAHFGQVYVYVSVSALELGVGWQCQGHGREAKRVRMRKATHDTRRCLI